MFAVGLQGETKRRDKQKRPEQKSTEEEDNGLVL